MTNEEFKRGMELLTGDYRKHFEEMPIEAKVRWKQKFYKCDMHEFKTAINSWLDDTSVNKYPPRVTDIQAKMRMLKPRRENLEKGKEVVITKEQQLENLKKLSELRKTLGIRRNVY